jgi:hypothetical protein
MFGRRGFPGSQLKTWARVACLGFAFSLAAGLLAVAQDASKPEAQQTPPAQSPTPKDQKPPQPDKPAAKEPEKGLGEGAQVRTGSVIGSSTLDHMFALLADHQFPQMLAILASEDGTSLPPEQQSLFKGVLANRENKPRESIAQLAPLLDAVTAAGNLGVEKLVRKTLAEDYLRAGDLAKANQSYQAFLQRMANNLSPAEKDEIELPLKLLPLAAANPAMTVEPGDSFSLPYDRDALGLTDIPVFVDAHPHDWMLDPTAPFNLIARSTAREVGLKLSDETATVHTITGREMTVRMTLIPRFTIGTVTYRNMTAFVFEDADYFFPKSKYQVQGVLGYPAVSALGSLTIRQNSRIDVQPGDKGERLTGGAPFYLDGDQIVLALGKKGDERIFQIDAAGQQTYLTSRYLAEHTDDFASQKMQFLAPPAAANSKEEKSPGYVADTVKLPVGDQAMTLHFVQVFTQPLGSAAVDDSYGVLGMDALDELISYTFDYRTMRFAIRIE